jgi:hypothetical protein
LKLALAFELFFGQEGPCGDLVYPRPVPHTDRMVKPLRSFLGVKLQLKSVSTSDDSEIHLCEKMENDEAEEKTRGEIWFRQFLQEPIGNHPVYMRPLVAAAARKHTMNLEDWDYYVIAYCATLFLSFCCVCILFERWILFDSAIWLVTALKRIL